VGNPKRSVMRADIESAGMTLFESAVSIFNNLEGMNVVSMMSAHCIGCDCICISSFEPAMEYEINKR